MDHETAVRTGATERYLLGDMTGADRDAFEEHYFVCAECAEDVRALTVFSANAKAVFREEAARPFPRAGMPWFNPALRLSAALNAVLVCALGFVLIRVPTEKPQFVQEVTILGPSRGPGNSSPVPNATGLIIVSFYLPKPFHEIGYELKDGSGVVRGRQLLPAPRPEPSGQSHLSVPIRGLESGGYEVRIWGVDGAAETEFGKSRFNIGGSAQPSPR